ncbi:MAG: OsmC family protein [Bradymonadia bacterium]
MSEHTAVIRWTRETEGFAYENYNRSHTWGFDAGITVPASAATTYLGDADRVDPEEALVAAVSSCHMLTLLAIASKRGWVVDAYEDDAVGTLGKNDKGRLAVTRIVLRPKVAFSGEQPSEEQLEWLHTSAHRGCFIANSITTEVVVEPS